MTSDDKCVNEHRTAQDYRSGEIVSIEPEHQTGSQAHGLHEFYVSCRVQCARYPSMGMCYRTFDYSTIQLHARDRGALPVCRWRIGGQRWSQLVASKLSRSTNIAGELKYKEHANLHGRRSSAWYRSRSQPQPDSHPTLSIIFTILLISSYPIDLPT